MDQLNRIAGIVLCMLFVISVVAHRDPHTVAEGAAQQWVVEAVEVGESLTDNGTVSVLLRSGEKTLKLSGIDPDHFFYLSYRDLRHKVGGRVELKQSLEPLTEGDPARVVANNAYYLWPAE